MDPPTWNRRLKRELERRMSSGLLGERETTLEEVSLTGSYPDTEVAVLVRDSRRPGFVFGFRWGSVRPWVEREGPESFAEDPENLATIIEANLSEVLCSRAHRGLEKECDPVGVTWIP